MCHLTEEDQIDFLSIFAKNNFFISDIEIKKIVDTLSEKGISVVSANLADYAEINSVDMTEMIYDVLSKNQGKIVIICHLPESIDDHFVKNFYLIVDEFQRGWERFDRIDGQGCILLTREEYNKLLETNYRFPSGNRKGTFRFLEDECNLFF